MPLPIQRYDDPFLPYSKAVIAATYDCLQGYVFDFAAYFALGGAGAVALERSIAYAAAGGDVVTILDGPFFGPALAEAMSENALNVDAVTLIDQQDTVAYRARGVEGIVLYDIVLYEERADAACFLCGDQITAYGHPLRLLGDEVFDGASGDDFVDRIREAVLRYHD
ncbi:MAG: hypothetical protein SNJ59_00335 [Aggregatilineales bacterium]